MMKRFLPSIALSAIFPAVFLAHFSVAQDKPSEKPADAVMLFDGTQESLDKNWLFRNGKPAGWTVEDNVMTSKGQDIVSKEKYQDFTLHVEFCEPQMGDDVKGQARGNSGVFLQGRYEIQVLDSFGLPASKVDCGAIYNQKAPSENAGLAPGEWQTYDITFKAAKFDDTGKKTAKARVTVIWNGKKVQDDAEIDHCTGSELSKESANPGPVLLQFHHNSVKFRNVWIVPAE